MPRNPKKLLLPVDGKTAAISEYGEGLCWHGRSCRHSNSIPSDSTRSNSTPSTDTDQLDVTDADQLAGVGVGDDVSVALVYLVL